MEKFRSHVVALIAHHAALDVSAVEALLERPKDELHGDFAFPCFSLSKTQRKAPASIAKDLAAKILVQAPVAEVTAVGAYINIRIEPAAYALEVISALRQKDFGVKAPRKKERVMIEFGQVNTHKPVHIGHFRNLCLGDSLIRLWRFAGHEVIAANYPGDVGAHVAKCLWGLQKFHGSEQVPEKHRGEWLGFIYAEANEKIEQNPDYKDEVSKVLQKLESGEPAMTKLWNETRQWCLDEFNEIFAEFQVGYDVYFYESEVEKPGKLIVQDILKQGVAKESDGAIIVDLEEFALGVFVVLKTDGTSLYATKDLALARQKFEQFKIERNVYVVASEQKFYFQQLFKTLELMGFPHAKDCFHLNYELVMLPEGKMSSREGNIVTLRMVYEEVRRKAAQEVAKRHEEWDSEKKKYTAYCIALAAMKFAMLDQDNNKTIIFNIEKSLEFEGETGPYVQYAIARINSILRKHDSLVPHNPDVSALVEPTEIRLVKLLGEFPDVVSEAQQNFRPMRLCKYLIELAQCFNNFYQACPILNAEQAQKTMRLALINLTKDVLTQGLRLLGIPALDEM